MLSIYLIFIVLILLRRSHSVVSISTPVPVLVPFVHTTLIRYDRSVCTLRRPRLPLCNPPPSPAACRGCAPLWQPLDGEAGFLTSPADAGRPANSEIQWQASRTQGSIVSHLISPLFTTHCAGAASPRSGGSAPSTAPPRL